jgi:UDP-N-acetylglucosamine 4,6-dehydratase/5-epimerase
MSGILITGGSGFLGQALVQRLFKDGHQRICIFSRGEYPQARMRSALNDDPRLRWFIGDVRDVERLERAMKSVDCVIHAAALKRIEVGAYCPDEMIKTNVLGSMNVIEAARRTGVRRLVLVSSDKAFEPVSPYGQSKAMAESLFLAANDPQGPHFSVVRYGNVAGSTGSVIPTWRELIAKDVPVPITDPDCTRFWMTKEEAAKLVVDTLMSMQGGELAIPELPAFRLGDLAEAMGAEKLRHIGLQDWEKPHESMKAGNSSETARRLDLSELRERLKAVA